MKTDTENEAESELSGEHFPIPNNDLVVGGTAEGYPLVSWPHYKGMPLAYLARYYSDGGTYFIFLDGPSNEMDDSWQPEQGSNAVVFVAEGIVNAPAWITLSEVPNPLERLTEVHEVPVRDTPEWLQGDEYQEGFRFIGQIDSDLDRSLNIGDAHGVAYVFIDDNTRTGRVLWQA